MAAHQVKITDRAKRYRAQNNVTGPRKCVLCGSRADLGLMHLTGDESHGETANLAYGCRSCNGKLAVVFKAVGAGKPTNQYNPSSGVPTFEQYMWAVSNHERKAHDAGGAVIHATPKHKRIEYARRIVSKAQATKRERADERWNPPAKSVVSRAAEYNENSHKWRIVEQYSDGSMRRLKGAFKTKAEAEAGPNKSNPWPFSRPDARRTTPASGGIAYHMVKSRKRADDKNAEFLKAAKLPKAATFKGRAIKPTEGGSWVVPSIDKESEFDSLQDAKAFITSWKRNPAKVAAEVFEDFHGFEPTEVVTVSKKVHHHGHLASLGELVQLDVFGVDERGHKVTGFKGAILACNEARDQLFIEGGDQRMDLKSFGIKTAHEMETLGQVTNIGYKTNKTHLGDEGGEAVYVHRFRATNQNGKHVVVKMTREPDLIYDVRNEQLLLSGGSYEILREGINK